MFTRPARSALLTCAALMSVSALAACSTGSAPAASTSASASATTASKEVVLLSHDSFDFPKELLEQFEKESGYHVTINAVGDGGTLANQLVLTKEAPIGDAVYGLDNTVSGRLNGQKIIADAGLKALDPADQMASEPGLVPIDRGDVCVNFDKTWFADKGLTPPTSFDDLVKLEYKDTLVAMNPASSTPGMAFMLATIAKYGEDGYVNYWKALKANGVKITDGWSSAFNVDYSAGEGKGSYPMMVSYGSSPAYSVNEAGTETSTGSITSTCYRQVEYAGVLTGAKNPEGAKKFVEFMMTPTVQEAISSVTYMHPYAGNAPEALVKFGPLSDTSARLDPMTIAQKSATWLREWQAAVQ